MVTKEPYKILKVDIWIWFIIALFLAIMAAFIGGEAVGIAISKFGVVTNSSCNIAGFR